MHSVMQVVWRVAPMLVHMECSPSHTTHIEHSLMHRAHILSYVVHLEPCRQCWKAPEALQTCMYVSRDALCDLSEFEVTPLALLVTHMSPGHRCYEVDPAIDTYLNRNTSNSWPVGHVITELLMPYRTYKY